MRIGSAKTEPRNGMPERLEIPSMAVFCPVRISACVLRQDNDGFPYRGGPSSL